MKAKIKRFGRILLKVIGIAVLALIIAITGFWFRVSEIKLSDSVPEIDKEREARVLTAFFGIDNELPLFASFLYWKARYYWISIKRNRSICNIRYYRVI